MIFDIMKKVLLFFTLLSFCAVGYSQEEPTTLEKLMSYQWTSPVDKVTDLLLNYSTDAQVYDMIMRGENVYHESYRFYVSDEPEWIFDETKLGSSNGIYIITEGKKGERCSVKKILGLAHQTLQIQYVKDPEDNAIWIGDPTAKRTYKGSPK